MNILFISALIVRYQGNKPQNSSRVEAEKIIKEEKDSDTN
jgi:hypothetical protein|tara:strand:- start:533 stop:652 length:120 start_codon:yes stop_codon:yes gene_type:complete